MILWEECVRLMYDVYLYYISLLIFGCCCIYCQQYVNHSKVFTDHAERPKVSMKGQWIFSRDKYNNDLINVSAGRYDFNFLITGDGAFENRPPWKLYIFIGDPDEMNRYIFNKK